MKKRLGEILIEQGVVTPTQLKDALTLQRRKGIRLGEALVQLGHVAERDMLRALSAVLGIRMVELEQVTIERPALALVRARFAAEHLLLPVAVTNEKNGRVLTVAMSDPLNARVIDELRFVTGCRIEPVLATRSAIHNMILRVYERMKPRRIDDDRPIDVEEGEEDTMTILRGRSEEVVRTFSGPDPRGVIPLTEEVQEPSPFETPTPPPRRPSSVSGVGPLDLSSRAGLPQYPSQAPPPAGRVTQITDHYGVLVGRSGGVVDADAFFQLERRFWALMRVMVRKGMLTPEEFVAELSEQ